MFVVPAGSPPLFVLTRRAWWDWVLVVLVVGAVWNINALRSLSSSRGGGVGYWGQIEWLLLLLLVLLSLPMEKNKVIRAKTKMTHNNKIAALAQESLNLSLVLSLSLKTIIAIVDCCHTNCRESVAAASEHPEDHHESAAVQIKRCISWFSL